MTHQVEVTSSSPGASLSVKTEQTDAHRTVFNTDARASRACEPRALQNSCTAASQVCLCLRESQEVAERTV